MKPTIKLLKTLCRRLLLLALPLLCAPSIRAAGAPKVSERVKYKDGPAYIYRLYLTDKLGTPYSLDRPSRYLSRRSIERRKRQGLSIDSTDLPVNPTYVQQVRRQGFHVIGQSRWQNTLLVCADDSCLLQQCRRLPFIRDCRLVWQAPDSINPSALRVKWQERFEEQHRSDSTTYGRTYGQVSALRGNRLHEIGMHGEGMMIAVIDGGFKNANHIPALTAIDVCGVRDFVYPPSHDIYSETDHGTKVLSAMATHVPNYFVGTAPRSSYWLLRSEDMKTEQEVEEDYWTMATEFADSVGCDLINSSLGYNEYDFPQMSHRLWQLDGQTAFISRSASMLAQKGIVLVNSAGNSGMGSWKKIGVPADADHILSVGAISPDRQHRIAPFSSVGPSQDGRIKPDIVATGAPAFLVNGRGAIMEDMGTSFSTPIVCGLAACLWQALPEMTALELIQLILQSSNNYQHPDNIYGYGMPDFWRAYMIGKSRKREADHEK